MSGMMFLDVVGDNFGLFQTGSRCSNPAKISMNCKILSKTGLVMRKPLCFAVCFGWAGPLVDFDLKAMCCMSVIYLL